MFQRNICYIIIICSILTTSCRKDRTLLQLKTVNIGCIPSDSVLLAVKDTLYAIPANPSPLGWQAEIKREFQYFCPCFNPNNNNEFVYIRQDRNRSLTTCDVRILNLCTGQDRLIANNAYIGGSPSWSTTGWIVFLGSNGQDWKVSEQGIGLTQITPFGFNEYPIWNPQGNEVLYQNNNDNLATLVDSAGNFQKNITKLNGTPYTSWTWDTKLAVVTGNNIPYGIGYYDFVKDTIILISTIATDPNSNLFVASVLWFNQNKSLLWSSAGQIAITDTFSKQTTIIRKGGNQDNVQYGYINVSGDEKKIITERVDIVSFDTLNPIDYFKNYENNIYIFNIDGSGLRKVKFP